MKILFAVVGLGLIAIAIALALSTRGFVRRASRAEGVVVGLNAGESHPEIEFTPASGPRVSFSQGGFISGYKQGRRVEVLYDADRPARTARVNAPGALWFVPVLLGALGIAFLCAGVFGKASSFSPQIRP